MSSGDDIPTGGEWRDGVEREAEVVRTRLSNRLALLDQRKDQVVDSVKAFTKPPRSIALLVGAGVALAATVLIIRKLRHRPSEFERMLAEFLTEAKLVPPRPESPLRSAVKRGLASAVTLGLREVGKRSVERLLAPSPDVTLSTSPSQAGAEASIR